MDTGSSQAVPTGLNAGEMLRLKDAAGRRLGVTRGSVWVTQEGDPRDHVIGRGESFRFDRDGLALITPVGESARVVLEDGPAAERAVGNSVLAVTGAARPVRSPEFERRALRLRARTMTDAFARLVDVLARLRARITTGLAATAAGRRTIPELRRLDERALTDIGARRDRIDFVARGAARGAGACNQ